MRTQGPDGEIAEFPVDWVIGGKRMQDDGHRVSRRALAGAAGLLPRDREELGRLHRDQARRADPGASVLLDERAADGEPRVPRLPHHRRCGVARRRDRPSGRRPFDRRRRRVRGLPRRRRRSTPTRGNGKPTSCTPARPAASVLDACARATARASRCCRCSTPTIASELGQRYDEVYDPIVVTLPGGGTSSDFFADGRPRRRASSTRRCCSRRAIARATRPA